MNGKANRLAERRERLIAEAAAQRVALARGIEPWRAPLALADQGLAALRAVRRHPVLFAGGIALLIALKPARAGAWLRRGWTAWLLLRKLR